MLPNTKWVGGWVGVNKQQHPYAPARENFCLFFLKIIISIYVGYMLSSLQINESPHVQLHHQVSGD